MIKIHPIEHSQKNQFDLNVPNYKDNFRIGPLEQVCPIKSDTWTNGDLTLVPLFFYMSRYDHLGQSDDNYWTNFAKKEELIKEFCKRLVGFDQSPEKFIFFLVGDDWNIPEVLRHSIVFQLSSAKSSNSLPLPYYDLNVSLQEMKHRFDMSFVGNLSSHPIRSKLASILKSQNIFIQDTKKPFYFHDKQTQKDLKMSYNLVMNASNFILCPRGVGLNSIRFYEALSLGKIPILISDNCKLPFEKELESLIVKVAETEIEKITEKVKEVPINNGMYARKFFLEKLHISKFKQFIESSIKEKYGY